MSQKPKTGGKQKARREPPDLDLTPGDVELIRKLHDTGMHSVEWLAEKFDQTPNQIKAIVLYQKGNFAKGTEH